MEIIWSFSWACQSSLLPSIAHLPWTGEFVFFGKSLCYSEVIFEDLVYKLRSFGKFGFIEMEFISAAVPLLCRCCAAAVLLLYCC